jgi:hypothetical protein
MTLRPSIQFELARPIANNHYLNVARSFDANWILLCSNKDFGRSAPPFEYEVSQFEGHAWHSALTIGPTGRQYFNAEKLPDNRWLLIAGRSRTERQIPNGDIFDKNGNLIASLNLGDGIEHVQAAPSGDIWIGYCDEGIFGGGDLEQEGLICFSQDGTPKVRFFQEIVDANSVPSIDDCYALNVCRDGDAWVCYYSGFPIVRMKHCQFDASWTDFPARPVRALAVNGEKLLMVPAYRQLGLLYLCDLPSRSLEQIEFVNDPGQSVEFDITIGRDATLGFASLKDPARPILYQLDFG